MMSAVTYGGARTPASTAGESVPIKRKKSLFVRFLQALKESRQKEARRVIERHGHLLRSDDSLMRRVAPKGRNDEALFDRT
jgi:hypothetical protein